jgi:hypothetical protein
MESETDPTVKEELRAHNAKLISDFIVDSKTTEMGMLINVTALCQYYFLQIPDFLGDDRAKEFFMKFPTEMQLLIMDLDELLERTYESWGRESCT